MSAKTLLSAILFTVFFFVLQVSYAQDKTVTGKVTDSKDGTPVIGASVLAKGSQTGTTTGNDGSFTITVGPKITTLIISSVGFETQEVSIKGVTSVNVEMALSGSANLNEVIVVGYGTARRKDLTGSYALVTARHFNQVPSATPDQLLQGKVAGLQITVASGQPGAATSVRIRGNNSIRAGTNPLYVVDGVPLDGRSARPTFSNISGLGNLPDANPLNYLNPSDIESISVLKDASASAIYGSRGANGVILITTRSGSTGPVKIDAAASVTYTGLLRQPDVLDAGQYRTALSTYGALSDSGASYKPFDEIIQHKLSANYSVAFSGGNSENGRYRASFLASTTPGIIRKSKLDKYIGNLNGSYRFLDKKLSINFGLTAASTKEQIAPVSNDVGSTGNIISNALQWNPTLLMKHSNGTYTVNPNGQVNPLAFSDGYNDFANVTSLLGYISAGYKIVPDLEYRILYGVNTSTGVRKGELLGWVAGTGGNNVPGSDGKGGQAAVGNTQLFSQTLTHTLTYTTKFSEVNFTGLVGYEYNSTSYKTQFTSVYGFDYSNTLATVLPIHLYDNMQDGKRANLASTSSNDPASDLQSYFARVQLNYKDKYSFSGSFRADGSNKFGTNNKYAYFPAVAVKWTVSSEDFMRSVSFFNNLSLRIGWGKTGNQSFPAGAAVDRYQYTSSGSLSIINFANPDLKWETVASTNGGIDFSILNNRLTGSIDVFFKKTNDPLFPGTLAAPAPSGVIWKNLDGYISNKGGELSLNGTIISRKDMSWTLGANVTYVKNKFVFPPVGNSPLVLTGQLNGKGTSATWSRPSLIINRSMFFSYGNSMDLITTVLLLLTAPLLMPVTQIQNILWV